MGFSNLVSIGGGLGIVSNPSLLSLSGFEKLETVGGFVPVSSNKGFNPPPERITQFSGFDVLREAGGSLDVRNDLFAQVDPLASLESVGGQLNVSPAVRWGSAPFWHWSAMTRLRWAVYTVWRATAVGPVTARLLRSRAYDALNAPPPVAGSLSAGSCPSTLPAGRFACRVQATGTFNGSQGQRYTVFLRVAETGRLAFRGETKPGAGQSVKFKTIAADPASFSPELVAEKGSAASPSGDAVVLGAVAFAKGSSLRADEALTLFPTPPLAKRRSPCTTRSAARWPAPWTAP